MISIKDLEKQTLLFHYKYIFHIFLSTFVYNLTNLETYFWQFSKLHLINREFLSIFLYLFNYYLIKVLLFIIQNSRY